MRECGATCARDNKEKKRKDNHPTRRRQVPIVRHPTGSLEVIPKAVSCAKFQSRNRGEGPATLDEEYCSISNASSRKFMHHEWCLSNICDITQRFWWGVLERLVTAIKCTYWMAATTRIRAAIGLNGLRTSIIRLDARLHVASTGFPQKRSRGTLRTVVGKL